MELTRIPDGGLNLDVTTEALDPKDYRFAKNIVNGRSTQGKIGGFETIKGTNVIAHGYAELDANATCIGTIKHGNANYLFFHNTDASKNCIIKLEDGTYSKVIVNSTLNFNLSYPINGGGVVGELLYWNDGYNQPRCIHLTRYSGSSPTIDSLEDLSIIKRPPLIPPIVRKWKGEPTIVSTSGGTPTADDIGKPVMRGIDQVGVLQSWAGSWWDIILTKTVGTNDVLSIPKGSGVTTTVTALGGGIYNPAPSVPSQVKDYSFQFAYQYKYKDGQMSVLSPYSKLMSEQLDDDIYTNIIVELPYNGGDETRPSEIEEVWVCYRIGNNGAFRTFKKIKENLGSWQDDIKFYNTVAGEVVPDSYLKPAELLPDQLKSMAIAKNRLFVANFNEGYAVPTGLDVTFTANESNNVDGGGVTATRVREVYNITKVRYIWNAQTEEHDPQTPVVSNYRIIEGLYHKALLEPNGIDPFDPATYSTTKIYKTTDVGKLSNVSDTIDNNDVIQNDTSTYYAHEEYDVFTRNIVTTPSGVECRNATVVDLGTEESSVYRGQKSFSGNSSYQLGIMFADLNGKPFEIYTEDDFVIDFQGTVYNETSYISWQINGTPPITTGIPTEKYVDGTNKARTYSIVMTKNLKKTYFFEGHATNMFYSKTDGDGNLVRTYEPSGDNQYIEIDIRGIIERGVQYSFINGDRIIIYDANGTGKTLDLPIADFDGTFIKCAYSFFDDDPLLAEVNSRIEVYRPRNSGDIVPFYQIGETYKLNNTGAGQQPEYSVLQGEIEGDCYLIQRPQYQYVNKIVEGAVTYSDSDTGYNLETGEGTLTMIKENQIYRAISLKEDEETDSLLWNTDAGRAFVPSNFGVVNKNNFIRWSNTFIEGTSLNGLGEFEPLNEISAPIDGGSIQKLQLTTSSQSQGDVLLVISQHLTSSAYLGQASMNIADGTSFLINSVEIVGDIRTQKRAYGTLNPESVKEYNGDVIWWDDLNRSLVRYTDNGIFPISEYGAITHFERMGALNTSTDFVHTGFDPFYKMFFITFQNADSVERKTISFSATKNRWVSFYDFAPEMYFEDRDKMYSVVDNTIYAHNNTTNYNTFYGVAKEGWITVAFNDSPILPKEWQVFSFTPSESLIEWNLGDQRIISGFVKASFSAENGQGTDLIDTDFEVDEGIAYGALLMDINNGGNYLTGDPMVSRVLEATLKIITDDPVSVTFLRMGCLPSNGHRL